MHIYDRKTLEEVGKFGRIGRYAGEFIFLHNVATESSGNVYTNTTGSSADIGSGTVFTPQYSATLDATSGLEAAIRAGAGPK